MKAKVAVRSVGVLCIVVVVFMSVVSVSVGQQQCNLVCRELMNTTITGEVWCEQGGLNPIPYAGECKSTRKQTYHTAECTLPGSYSVGDCEEAPRADLVKYSTIPAMEVDKPGYLVELACYTAILGGDAICLAGCALTGPLAVSCGLGCSSVAASTWYAVGKCCSKDCVADWDSRTDVYGRPWCQNHPLT